ncbi:carcinoembryonic antigen-related cell adhesion molecule 1-like [Carassius carassius]|uniref:carcinoembryonic antigen-related cell adhesion molecule 1-like n=1 Tax=Carassius carassius TaxID=217509 RepID=UPI0028696684|nr:carcinoembryonic antigen-related cell adhesion molecule 1-like [Carassius carassius]
MKVFILCIILCTFFVPVASVGPDVVSLSVMEGDAVTLYTGLNKSQQERMKWYFHVDRIAEISGDQSKICTDDECKERFRDRLKLDHQTGSLTIMNIRITDSGLYKLLINSSEKIFNVTITGVSDAGSDPVQKLVKKGDSVTLSTGVEVNKQKRMMWYFNNSRIAYINGDLKICTDDECKERFRDRLELDHQTGSLTIRNTRNTDSGEYKLLISGSSSGKIFNVTVTGVSDAGSDPVQILVKKGDSVTLHTDVEVNQEVRMMWYFNNVRIAYINGDLKICTDDVCKERFRDRLKLDRQTGSLTIMNITNTDSGEYQLKMGGNSRRKIFNVTVTDSNADKNEKEPQKEKQEKNIDATVPGSGPSSAVVAVIVGGVLLLAVVFAVVGVMIHCRRSSRNDEKKIKQVPELVSEDETQNERRLMT